jgi:hypothetical protein
MAGMRLFMASTLDKLKALNDKLEAKLTRQDGATNGNKNTSKTRKRGGANSSEKRTNEQKVQLSHENVAKTLIKYMNVDAYAEPTRADNLKRVAKLYVDLGIAEKAPDVESLFIYKAMNISGISLKEEDFGEIRAGKYVQVIAITYEPDKDGKKKAKNISLGYFGKAETLDDSYKNEIIEFVLRWRYEKAFQNLEHYKDLIEHIGPSDDTLF